MIKEKEITENNKLIAEFMDVSKCTDENHAKNPCYYFEDKYQDINYARYHSSWDWLMLVVNKIHSLDVYYQYIEETSGQFGKDEMINTKFIEVTWENVVEFIKWYNQNKK